jgi:hypothetical protein
VSTAPYAFIARGYCPVCRHELTGLPYADLVRCPECGAATESGELPLTPPPGPLARFFSFPPQPRRRVACIAGLAFAFLVMAGIVGQAFLPVRCGCGRALTGATQLRLLNESLQFYAAATGGVYPAHAAVLVTADYFTPEMLVDNRAASTPNLMVGDVDLWLFDWSPEATAQLDAAITSCDVSTPYYRTGDCWLVRLPKPTYSPLLVAGWCDVVADGARWVVFDDNQVKAIDRRGWIRIWSTDAGERARLGLPRVQAPPWSDDGGCRTRGPS